MNLQNFGLIAQSAYETDPQMPGLTSWTISRQNSSATVYWDAQIACVAFRGTDDVEDWKHNLNTSWAILAHGRAHQGFMAAMDLVWPEVVTFLQSRFVNSCGDQTRDIYWTGHSLGGAMAQLSAYYWHRYGYPINGICTFGQPRLASARLAHYLNQFPIARVVNHADVVPKVPRFRFHHSGDLYYIDSQKTLHLPGNASALYRWWDTIGSRRKSVSCHMMSSYLEALEGVSVCPF